MNSENFPNYYNNKSGTDNLSILLRIIKAEESLS
jgi:hypothetical protein